jgi:hypothetical protein
MIDFFAAFMGGAADPSASTSSREHGQDHHDCLRCRNQPAPTKIAIITTAKIR